MEEREIRLLTGAEDLRAAQTLFLGSLHVPPATDEKWAVAAESYVEADTFGAFEGTTMVGTAVTLHSRIRLPGGATVPMAAVTRVGVRADRTRRGVLTELMRAQLAGTSAPIATLRATEGAIYRRFGYGVATRGTSVAVDVRKARLHENAPTGGDVRLLSGQDEALAELPTLLSTLPIARTGGIVLPTGYWNFTIRRSVLDNENMRYAVHRGVDGDDGFVAYSVKQAGDPHEYSHVLTVRQFFATNPQARAELWRFLLSVDLVHSVVVECLPLDEPLALMLTNPRACRVHGLEDETWLRLVDVPAALAARSYGEAEPVVVAVEDAFLPANSGSYRITPDGVGRTDLPAQLRTDVATLSSAYLGDVSPSGLAAAGRIAVLDERALPSADLLFASSPVPWCGTYF